MKTVTLMYFAQLGAQAGCSEEQVETGANTVAELFLELKGIHGWTLPADKVRFARNDAFCPAEAGFSEGDALAIMPPMSGG
ncbi:MoaD/ThiS family protein [Cerasicoccus maritimus]|uniref:MoaD/ThiS family protein n=1 Tax=Cerasicoccus maritimus TaxID=490089 RepID=UPI002852D070|nr:MoaD/ThiS family protein [Cerasicoccus maritimus]